MKECLLTFYRQSSMGKVLLSIPRGIYKSFVNRWYSDEAWCRSMFQWAHGYALDLDHPRTLNEKIQWLKLNNRNPEFTKWADKHEVRAYIKDRLGDQYLIPQLAVADDPHQIDFAAFPEPFIIKPTHSSGQVTIVRDKSEMDWPLVINECQTWLKGNYYRTGREWHYKNITPRIVVERLMVDDTGNIPLDFKFHCFHGRVAAIQIDIDRETDHKRSFYDSNWELLPFDWSVCAGGEPLWPRGRDIEKPTVLPELIALTEKLAKPFDYVRVDWYVVGTKIFFGEVTFHHGGGYERILPFEWDRKLGKKLHLPNRDYR